MYPQEVAHASTMFGDIPNRFLAGRSFEEHVSAWPQLKIARAVQHRMDLEARIDLWASGKPFTPQTGVTEDRLRWQTKIKVFTPPPLFEWSLIFGDCLHALRGALDACVWELAHLHGAKPPSPHLLQFPILTDRAKWAKSKRDRLQTVPEDVADRIEVLQPFNRPAHEVNRDALVCLSWLNNIDKHRSNIAVNVTCNQLTGTVKVKFDEPEVAKRNSSPRMIRYDPELVDGAVLVEFLFQEPIANVQDDCSFRFVFTAETPSGKEDLLVLTDNLIQYVEQILDGLLGAYVEEDAVADSEIEVVSEWRSTDIAE